MTYREAMDRYGIDRPDLRYGLEIADISDLAAKTDFKVFREALEKNKGLRNAGVVRAIRVPGGGEKLTRKITDGYGEFVKTFGAGGVPVVKYTAAGPGDGHREVPGAGQAGADRAAGAPGGRHGALAADAYNVAVKSLGELRQKVARDMGQVPEWGKAWKFCGWWTSRCSSGQGDEPLGGDAPSVHRPRDDQRMRS